MEDQCHILPFFIPETSKVKIEYVDLSGDVSTIRGIFCVKKKLDTDINVHICNKIVKDPIFYWVPANSESVLEKGLELVRKGLGFPLKGDQGPPSKTITKKNNKGVKL
ncbi:hypothetical protein EROM_031360 [Encephalitozoon romaleae SJ-2008]|uniref:Uncharacterized protein n=1 Tax=Encephalitozoon romaleae (strain SJ-2008) TaxID=1178016 RepID=I6ZHT1_ENCRO|nr:hypothetical protein EROM_031360 [Encephalitozoon romaleae SJ-2008]AFN82758.1 hypothetical protein EROM_031360 [Encephalitozoon romaleae SJ-2008]